VKEVWCCKVCKKMFAWWSDAVDHVLSEHFKVDLASLNPVEREFKVAEASDLLELRG